MLLIIRRENMIKENQALAEYRQEILDQEQQIIDLEQKVEFVSAQRDHYKKDSDSSFTQADVDKILYAERIRAWKENKQFQYDLAEENARLTKQLTTKHDVMCRLQRQLAEEHNKLLDALESNEDLLSKLSTPKVDFKKHVGTDYKLIVDKVNILWEERYDS